MLQTSLNSRFLLNNRLEYVVDVAELQGDPGQVKSLSTSLRLVSFFEKKADLLSG